MSPVPDKMFVTADCVTLRFTPEEGLRLLLVERAHDPYKGCWALPGGFVELDEDLGEAAERELKEETGVEVELTAQIAAFGTPGRDPRGRNVTVAYLGLVPHGQAEARAGDDAARAAWHPVGELHELAFDHAEIVEAGMELLWGFLTGTHAAYLLLPEEFGASELGRLLVEASGGECAPEDAMGLLSASHLEQADGEEDAAARFRCVANSYLDPPDGNL